MTAGNLKQVGPYQIVERIGRGGMAAVYRAYQPSLDRQVAIKVMTPQFLEEPAALERFRREARAIAKLNHPNILQVYDFGQDGDYLYIVSQLIEGGTLHQRLGQPVDLRFAVHIMKQLANALDYAHEHGIVHRDVKPRNVLMDRGDSAILSDFGIVKLTEGGAGLTGTGLVVGTPDYMSPEQVMNEPLDGRSDLYSLAVVLYEMVTGILPFRADTPVAVIMGHLQRNIPDPTMHNASLPSLTKW